MATGLRGRIQDFTDDTRCFHCGQVPRDFQGAALLVEEGSHERALPTGWSPQGAPCNAEAVIALLAVAQQSAMNNQNLLIWNAGGLNSRARRSVVRNLDAQEHASVICLQETKVADGTVSMAQQDLISITCVSLPMERPAVSL